MKTPRNVSGKESFERLPIHFQQALLIASNILRRISEKRLDNSEMNGLLNVVPTTCGDKDEA